jgi:hypothetical protein
MKNNFPVFRICILKLQNGFSTLQSLYVLREEIVSFAALFLPRFAYVINNRNASSIYGIEVRTLLYISKRK